MLKETMRRNCKYVPNNDSLRKMDEELFLYSSHNKNKDNNEIKDGKLKTDKS